MKERAKKTPNPGTSRIVGHTARRRILLALQAEGPMSPAELARSTLGKGIRVNVYSYHFKALERWGLLEAVGSACADDRSVAQFSTTQRLTQSILDAAALGAISEVVGSVPEGLSQWIDGPYIAEISALIEAAGRGTILDP